MVLFVNTKVSLDEYTTNDSSILYMPRYDANLSLSETFPNLKKKRINFFTVKMIKSRVKNMILNKKNVDVK